MIISTITHLVYTLIEIINREKAFIFVSDSERLVMDKIESNIKELEQYKKTLNKLSSEYPRSLSRIKIEKEEQIKSAVNKVNDTFKQIIDAAKERQKTVISQLNAMMNDQSNDDDEKNEGYSQKEQSLLSASLQILQSENEILVASQSVVNDKLKTMQDEKLRRAEIRQIWDKVQKQFDKIKRKLNENIANIAHSVECNNKTIVDIHCNIGTKELTNILSKIKGIGSIVSNIENPLAAPKLKWSKHWNHGDGILFLADNIIKSYPQNRTTSGCCADFVIRKEKWNSFKWKVVVPLMDYETYVGFIDHEKADEWLKNGLYPDWSMYPCKNQPSVIQVWGTGRKIKVKKQAANKSRIVLEFEANMKNKYCKVWFHGQYLGAIFKDFSNAIISAVSSYNGNNNDYEIL